jgi:hypothetical protein
VPSGLDEVVAKLRRDGAEVTVAPFAYATSHLMHELRVVDRDGGEEVLVAKARAVALRCSKPRDLVDPRREAAVYHDILTGAQPVPRLRLATATWLVLERVDGVPLTEIGGVEAWAGAARRLAALHEELAGMRLGCLLRRDAAWVARCAEHAARATGRRLVRELARRPRRLAERLAAEPAGLHHGDLFPGNVLVRASGEPCFLDWELAGAGPQLLDLAALVAGGWQEPERQAIALAYRSARRSPPRVDEFLAALDACRLVVALQLLGWAPGWLPPPEHRHDWLGDVEELATRLELL